MTACLIGSIMLRTLLDSNSEQSMFDPRSTEICGGSKRWLQRLRQPCTNDLAQRSSRLGSTDIKPVLNMIVSAILRV